MANRIIILLYFFCFSELITAQVITENNTDDILHQAYQKIYNTSQMKLSNSYVLVDTANNQFLSTLKTCCTKFPQMIHQQLNKLDSDIYIINSKDGHLRIYSWNTWHQGNWSNYRHLFHYQSLNLNILQDQIDTSFYLKNEDAGFYQAIEQVGDSPYYILVRNFVSNSKKMKQQVEIVVFKNNQLQKIPIIKTPKGLLEVISIEYDIIKSYQVNQKLPKLIHFDSTTQTLKIPLVYDDGFVSGDYQSYQFNGSEFLLKKSKKNKKKN